MKSKDFSLIIVVAAISVIVAIFVSKLVITSPKNRQEKVEVVQPISPDFNTPDKKYFNDQSVDPTQLVKIGGGSGNKQPFSGGN